MSSPFIVGSLADALDLRTYPACSTVPHLPWTYVKPVPHPVHSIQRTSPEEVLHILHDYCGRYWRRTVRCWRCSWRTPTLTSTLWSTS